MFFAEEEVLLLSYFYSRSIYSALINLEVSLIKQLRLMSVPLHVWYLDVYGSRRSEYHVQLQASKAYFTMQLDEQDICEYSPGEASVAYLLITFKPALYMSVLFLAHDGSNITGQLLLNE